MKHLAYGNLNEEEKIIRIVRIKNLCAFDWFLSKNVYKACTRTHKVLQLQ